MKPNDYPTSYGKFSADELPCIQTVAKRCSCGYGHVPSAMYFLRSRFWFRPRLVIYHYSSIPSWFFLSTPLLDVPYETFLCRRLRLFSSCITQGRYKIKFYLIFQKATVDSSSSPRFAQVKLFWRAKGAGLLGCNALRICRWIKTFRRSILPPYSVLKTTVDIFTDVRTSSPCWRFHRSLGFRVLEFHFFP
jgi:hypothetical protein